MNWSKLPAIDKRQAILDALKKHPNATAAEMRELLGLADTNNCLSVTMTVMRKRGEIDHVIHPGKIGRHGYATWFALVKETKPQRKVTRNRARERKVTRNRARERKVTRDCARDGYAMPVDGRLCDPPYGTLPYEAKWAK